MLSISSKLLTQEHGFDMLKNFVFNVARAKKIGLWVTTQKILLRKIKETVGDKGILGLSGGVDSSVAAA